MDSSTVIQIPPATLIIIATGILGVFVGLIVWLTKSSNSKAFSSMKDKISDWIKSNDEKVNNAKSELDAKIENIKESRSQCEIRQTNSVNELKNQVLGMRDKWESFLEKYTIIDATRGNKVDALFRNVDEMKSTIREIKPAVYRKIEDMFKKIKNDLLDEVRDRINKEIKK